MQSNLVKVMFHCVKMFKTTRAVLKQEGEL